MRNAGTGNQDTSAVEKTITAKRLGRPGPEHLCRIMLTVMIQSLSPPIGMEALMVLDYFCNSHVKMRRLAVESVLQALMRRCLYVEASDMDFVVL